MCRCKQWWNKREPESGIGQRKLQWKLQLVSPSSRALQCLELYNCATASQTLPLYHSMRPCIAPQHDAASRLSYDLHQPGMSSLCCIPASYYASNSYSCSAWLCVHTCPLDLRFLSLTPRHMMQGVEQRQCERKQQRRQQQWQRQWLQQPVSGLLAHVCACQRLSE